jgi:muramoyltetrapeptide carboxypeptidase
MPGRIHLIAPAGSLQPFYAVLGIERASQLVAIVQERVGDAYRVTAEHSVIDATEDELRAGRTDDETRARDITSALADSDVRAMIAVRGGAWFARILPRIDFSVLDRRNKSIAVFGFSELTPLVNVVGAHRNGLGFYDMGPAFLVYGLKRHAGKTLGLSDSTDPTPDQWMRANLRHHIRDYFRRVVEIIESRGEPITLSARLARGTLPAHARASFVGGNLTVLSAMIGSMYADCVAPENHWIILEDFNDKPERIDRFLAHLTLARYWDRCEGLLLGDFHQADRDLGPAVLAMLEYHLPPESRLPILVTTEVGHTWPMTPVPLHKEAALMRDSDGEVSIRWSPECDARRAVEKREVQRSKFKK